ncbi:asparagine synthase (glutamine-hydrolyzing) [Luteibacter flocculans]|uniref:asparagine synthase (glutamine-hydrolyzing) n=1 Tax=Luteibacter flocculans TaxID=2780091 RepID=A0ABY4T6J9_9GAMM|nr:asparagine synthase (glutamine-hydrolyzing) [Luteibacter flocculans]URL59712.1 asparagine synthase (glutamine-hydrolyzing) [Luteibacter flocculans]
MCGIAGWLDFSQDIRDRRHIVEAMTVTLAARGPDGQGVWMDKHVGLGHRRLAVIDLAGGVQPMVHDGGTDTTVALSYNGEIYNFAALRAELEALGHRFTTRCDTEVVLRGYLQWEEGVVRRLEGMFAFAVWDARRQQLLLARDFLGVKPLYYQRIGNGVVFGSEPKALLAHPDVRARTNEDGLREIFVLARTPGRTPYADIHEVKPGEMLRFDREGMRADRFWRFEARPHEDDLPATIARVGELLESAVRQQIVSDVPLCTLLSGGLDSSAITAIAHAATAAQGQPMRTFSVDFVGQSDDFADDGPHKSHDAPFVRDFVRHVGCDHTDIVLDSSELAEGSLNRTVLHASDLPLNLSGDMCSSLYRLFREVRKESTVALSGESADEIFGGYAWFHQPAVHQARMFPWLTMTGSVFHGGDILDRGLRERLRLKEFQADSYATAMAEVPRLDGEPAHDARMREFSYLHMSRFLQFMLDRKDRMSMAVGLEVRVPFCDSALVDYVFNIPWDMKAFDGREKSVLRAAVEQRLPRSIVERTKSPYPSTQDPAYERALRARVAAFLDTPNHPARPLFDERTVRRMTTRPMNGDRSLHYQRADMERVLSVAEWIEAYDVELAC